VIKGKPIPAARNKVQAERAEAQIKLAPFADTFALAALLGHKTLAMTARYTHPTDDSKRRAIAALNGSALKSGHKMVTIDISTRASKAS
jgi:integrase